MAASYRIDRDQRLVFILPTEVTEAEDIASVFEQLLEDPHFDRTFQFISDRRGVTREPSSEYVRSAVAVIARYRDAFGDRRWAILIDPNKPAMFGMGRIAESVSEYKEVVLKLFTDYDAAVEWLREATPAAPGS